MKNQTLLFQKGDQKMTQKCGPGFGVTKEQVIKIMEKCGWTLIKVIG